MVFSQPPKARKAKPCWFDRELQNVNGNKEVLIASMDYQKMYKDAQKIFKDLMYRNVNLAEYGVYFINTELMSALYDNAYERFCRYSVLYNALFMYHDNHYKSAPNDTDILNYEVVLMNNYQRLFTAYNIIVEVLDNVKKTGDPSYLFSLSDRLNPYRQDLQNE